jgi:hypothetical protein
MTGKVVRLDSTVTAALLHEPSDSSLLCGTGSRHPIVNSRRPF